MARQARHTLITQKHAAEYLGVTDRTIRQMIADGRLTGYHLGPRIVRLRLDEVEAALRPMGIAADPPGVLVL